MSIWKVILATLVIFGAGVIAGALFVQQLHLAPAVATAEGGSNTTQKLGIWPRLSVNNTNAPGPAWQKAKKDFVNRFGEQLQLTDAQRVRIEQILGDSQKRTKEISDTIAPNLREEVRHTRELIRSELTPDQLHKYDQIFKGRGRKKAEDSKVKKSGKVMTDG